MERDGGFTGSRYTLYDHDRCIFIPDDRVLIALDGGDNVFHLVVGRLAELALQ
jgi:hypothetical protein